MLLLHSLQQVQLSGYQLCRKIKLGKICVCFVPVITSTTNHVRLEHVRKSFRRVKGSGCQVCYLYNTSQGRPRFLNSDESKSGQEETKRRPSGDKVRPCGGEDGAKMLAIATPGRDLYVPGAKGCTREKALTAKGASSANGIARNTQDVPHNTSPCYLPRNGFTHASKTRSVWSNHNKWRAALSSVHTQGVTVYRQGGGCSQHTQEQAPPSPRASQRSPRHASCPRFLRCLSDFRHPWQICTCARACACVCEG